jgi:hypothetical protein
VDLKVTINGEQITSPKRGMNSSCTCWVSWGKQLLWLPLRISMKIPQSPLRCITKNRWVANIPKTLKAISTRKTEKPIP